MADEVILINVDDGLKRVMNNAKLYVRLLGKFKDDVTFKGIEKAFAEGDMETSKTAAHTFKGLTANLSLSELYKQTVELEAQIKNGVLNKEQLAVVKDIYEKTLLETDKVITKYE